MGRGGSRTGGAGLAASLFVPKNDYKSSGQRRQILEHYQIIVIVLPKLHMALGTTKRKIKATTCGNLVHEDSNISVLCLYHHHLDLTLVMVKTLHINLARVGGIPHPLPLTRVGEIPDNVMAFIEIYTLSKTLHTGHAAVAL